MPEYHSVRYKLSDLTLTYIHDEVAQEFSLHPITEEQLTALRVKNKPGFILKSAENVYYTDILSSMRFFAHCGYEHLCTKCKRCSALSDEKGGCQKVRDFDKDTILHERMSDLREQMRYAGQIEKATSRFLLRSCLPESVKVAKRIEKYPFVTYGFETFGTNTESLVILKCKNFESSYRIWD